MMFFNTTRQTSPFQKMQDQDSISSISQEVISNNDDNPHATTNHRGGQRRFLSSLLRRLQMKRGISIRMLFRFATPKDGYLIAAACICSILVGCLQTASVAIFALTTSDAIESISAGEASLNEGLQPVVVGFAIVGGFIVVLAYIGSTLWIITGENQARSIRIHYIKSLMRQDMSWFELRDMDAITSRLALDMQQLQDAISERFGGLVRAIAAFVSGFMMAFIAGWQVAVVIIPVLPLLGIMAYLSIHWLVHSTYKLQDAYGDAASVAQQVVDNIRTVYAFSLQTRFSNMYKAYLVKTRKAGLRRGLYGGLCYAAFVSVLLMTYALAIWYSGNVIARGNIDGWRALTAILGMMLGSITFLQVPGHMMAIAAAYGVARKIFDTIDSTPTIDTPRIGQRFPVITGHIEFNNVSFHYATRPDLQVLNNVNFIVQPGTTVAIVGASGSGKSTVIQLIQRLYDVCSGKILVDGIDIKDVDVRWFRRHVAVVSQEPKLFNMTIRQNLLLGAPTGNITQEQMVFACIQANCHGFISALPDGYDTNVGGNGCKLSVGQRQRIAIARAIISNPPILLLDEATSALDTNSELAVQRALETATARRTTFIVAQRLSTIRNADQIIVIQHGKVAQVGTHQQLLQQRGSTYAKLVRLQEIAIQQQQREDVSDHEQRVAMTAATHQNIVDYEKERMRQTPASDNTSDYHTALAVTPVNATDNMMDAYEMRRTNDKNATKEMAKKRAPILKVIRQMHRNERWLLLLGIAATALAGFIFPAVAYVISHSILDLVQKDRASDKADAYGFCIFLFALAAFVIYALQLICFEAAGELYTERLRGQVFDAYLGQEVAYFDRHTTSVLTSQLAVEARNVYQLVTKVPGDIVQIIFTAITGLLISFLQSPLMTGVVSALSPIVMGASFYEAHIQRSYEHKSIQAHEQCNIIMSEAVKEIRTVVALGQQSFFELQYRKAIEHPHRIARSKAFLSSIGNSLNQGFMMHVSALSLHLGTQYVDQGILDPTAMFVCLFCVLVSVHSIGRLGAFGTTYARAKYAAIAVYSILERKPEIIPDTEGLEPASVDGHVAFHNVAFSYPTRPDTAVFNGDFTMEAKAGMTIGLVGPSGCGKSTGIGLLQRWYDPTDGDVILDGSSTRSYTLNSLRQPMALVSQEPVLFGLSIGDNIWLGCASHEDIQVTRQQVEDAARLVGMHDFITSLPQGYDTRVGCSSSSRGIQLSGGQKQRIALARALLRQPKILLLDEATSALDAESEQQIQAAIDQLIHQADRTIFIIAHTLSTVQNADLICYIRDGRIIEQGTHWELLRKRGEYATLVRLQSLR